MLGLFFSVLIAMRFSDRHLSQKYIAVNRLKAEIWIDLEIQILAPFPFPLIASGVERIYGHSSTPKDKREASLLRIDQK